MVQWCLLLFGRYMSSILQALASTCLRFLLFIVWNSLASNPVERSRKRCQRRKGIVTDATYRLHPIGSRGGC